MQKKWYRLDTAALIFPAIARHDWSNGFRLSATLKEEVDPEILQLAVEDLAPRFPSFYVTLHKGLFWYYLEQSARPPEVRSDYAYPLTFLSRAELRKSCLRILYYRNRIAVEFFHALTDGHGGSVYLANLTARYLERKHGADFPREGLLVDLSQRPTRKELEDSFLKNSAPCAAAREGTTAYRLRGSRDTNGFRHLTTGVLNTQALLDAAHAHGVTATAFLAAVMAKCLIEKQGETVPLRRQKSVRITIPVNLRKLYGSVTLRNFALVLNVGVDPRFGEYTFDELCKTIWHQISAGATRQNMAGIIASNVLPQRVMAIRLAPLFVKNLIMDLVYRSSGERGGCLNVSNLGEIRLPEQMYSYLERMEFIIGPQRSYPNNCSVLSCGGKTCINMIRSIRESDLERRFFSALVELGIAVEIESNGG